MTALVITIVIATLVAVFAGFNIDNRCDINLVLHTFHNIPVFVTSLVSFAIGMLAALPIAIHARHLKKDESKSNTKSASKIRGGMTRKYRFPLFHRAESAAPAASTAEPAAPSGTSAPNDIQSTVPAPSAEDNGGNL